MKPENIIELTDDLRYCLKSSSVDFRKRITSLISAMYKIPFENVIDWTIEQRLEYYNALFLTKLRIIVPR